ncbi:outer membrane biogenesis protein BamB [compost metagenome]
MKSHSIQIGNSFCEPSYFLLDGAIIYMGIHKNRPLAPSTVHGEFIAMDLRSEKIIWTIPLSGDYVLGNELNDKPILFENKIILSTRFGLTCCNRETGEALWSITYKTPSDTKCSLINGVLYCKRDNEIQRIDLQTGKQLAKRKHRIKWFDSTIQEHQGRYFASTSNSKIIELELEKFDSINEYTYSGGWAIAETPYFHKHLMISSSYAGEIIAFNLETNQPEWKIKKKAGSKPYQTFYTGSALFYDGHIDSKLQRLEILNKKKIWSRQLERLQAFTIRNEHEFLAVYKTSEDTYNLGLFNFNNGELIQLITSNEGTDWNEYLYDLWKGISIQENESYIVSNFKPNEITVVIK